MPVVAALKMPMQPQMQWPCASFAPGSSSCASCDGKTLWKALARAGAAFCWRIRGGGALHAVKPYDGGDSEHRRGCPYVLPGCTVCCNLRRDITRAGCCRPCLQRGRRIAGVATTCKKSTIR